MIFIWKQLIIFNIIKLKEIIISTNTVSHLLFFKTDLNEILGFFTLSTFFFSF